MQKAEVYGTVIHGDFPKEFLPYFNCSESLCPPAMGSVEVKYREIAALPQLDEIWVESQEQVNVSSRFALFRSKNGFGLSVQCQGNGLFRISRDHIEIEWLPGGTGAAHYFFSYALPLWLEYLGVVVLHASAVSLNGVSIAFLGKSGAGKSSMVASLRRLGCDLVADDGLPVLEMKNGYWQCLSGPPLLKLWPESIERFQNINPGSLDRVHESFEKRIFRHRGRAPTGESALKLNAIYILERRKQSEGDIIISSAGDAAAPIRLIEHSLAGGPASALGLSARRFEQLARLARTVPVRTLNYPGELKNFPRILAALAADLETTSSNAR
jgi:hypothetical protein